MTPPPKSGLAFEGIQVGRGLQPYLSIQKSLLKRALQPHFPSICCNWGPMGQED